MKNLLRTYRTKTELKRFTSDPTGAQRDRRRRIFSAVEAAIVLVAVFYSLYWALSISLAAPKSNNPFNGLQSESWTASPQNRPTVSKKKGGENLMAFESGPSNIVTVTPKAANAGTNNVAVPQNLAGVAADSKVVLTWEPSAGAGGYNVYRATGAGAFALLTTITLASPTPTYTDAAGPNNLLPAPVNGTVYRYQVTATTP
jgi:hypothetical protein